LGALALSIFSLAPDPVNQTLIPVIARQASMSPINALEEGVDLTLDFDKLAQVAQVGGVLPCAVQNADTNEVILVAYVNEQALKVAIETRSAVFWSTSRNELWEKGKTSGETFDLLEVRVNCEQNSLLYLVRPRRGGICHTHNAAGDPRDCFYRRLDFETWELENLDP
jgi:phosphoribosyl-AMP cyclohydrolase